MHGKAQPQPLELMLSREFRATRRVTVTRPRHHQVSDPEAERPIVMSEVRARQGVTGHNGRYVLGFGLAGAIIALTLLYLFYLPVEFRRPGKGDWQFGVASFVFGVASCVFGVASCVRKGGRATTERPMRIKPMSARRALRRR